MKFSVILAAAATAVLAQDLSTLPACAVECLSTAIAASGCKATDVACQCGEKKKDITNAATPCLLSKCTDPADLAKAATNGEALCKNLSASSSAAPASTAATNSSAPSTSKAATSAAVSTGAPKTNGTSVAPTAGPSSTGVRTSPSGTTGGSPAATSPAGTGAAATLGAGALLGLVGAMIAL